MRKSKFDAVELSYNKPFVHCGAVKRDNSEIKFIKLNEESSHMTLVKLTELYYSK